MSSDLSHSPAPPPIKPRSHKTVLLGDASVGKSSIVMRFVKNVFSDAMEATVGAAFATQTLDVDGKTVKFEIWDTAGQERFSSLAPMYYRGASAAIVVYDQSNRQSFERAQTWVKQLQLSGNPNIVIALAANKMDLPERATSLEQARQYADDNGLLFIETSAKTGQNIQQLFSMLARRLPEQPVQQAAAGALRLDATPNTASAKPATLSSRCCSSA
ncbi:unnamed protein product [Vitrella brassicaformis CCMP3155]|uniref:Uncharacterized protein n=2 Tax=Vitrella brassicaformis TaxID=1169539 RepID=A0A0G4EZ62_VITBC|nr:unnamed protein product [Vitrella brassicaformis CCMP3155]|eukprot:CEM04485.1 unnamed protein product [Vitrella brassicaformis CCMP3155]